MRCIFVDILDWDLENMLLHGCSWWIRITKNTPLCTDEPCRRWCTKVVGELLELMLYFLQPFSFGSKMVQDIFYGSAFFLPKDAPANCGRCCLSYLPFLVGTYIRSICASARKLTPFSHLVSSKVIYVFYYGRKKRNLQRSSWFGHLNVHTRSPPTSQQCLPRL